jgi:hypothetical protein
MTIEEITSIYQEARQLYIQHNVYTSQFIRDLDNAVIGDFFPTFKAMLEVRQNDPNL